VNYPPVLTKRSFVNRFRTGEFGNRGPMWDTIGDFLDDGCKGLIHIRNRVAGGPTWYDIPAELVEVTYRDITLMGIPGSQLYFAAMAPTEKTVLQGEVIQSVNGIELFYTQVAKPMRDALRENAKQISGILALETLKFFLDPSSFDWMQILLERYEGHVIEFSTYGCCWGTIPNRNTVVWEVRMY